MAAPYFSVGGTNILPYIEQGGLKWETNDLDAPNSGRTLDGVMHRGKVGEKVKYSIKCLPLSSEDLHMIYGLINSQYVTVVTNVDPVTGGYASRTMYNSSRSSTAFVIDAKNSAKGTWNDFSFNLIER